MPFNKFTYLFFIFKQVGGENRSLFGLRQHVINSLTMHFIYIWISFVIHYCISVPDRLVDSGIITIVAGSIGSDWARLARQLGICDSDIGSYELDNHHLGVHEVAYQMLRDWIERNGSEAKVQLIAKALVAVKRPDVALKLSSCALAAHKQWSKVTADSSNDEIFLHFMSSNFVIILMLQSNMCNVMS